MKKLQQMLRVTLATFFVSLLTAGTFLVAPQKVDAATPVFGDVMCVNGTINGVWFDDLTNNSYDGWAAKLSYTGASGIYNWKKTVGATTDKYKLHVGCNGVWGNSPYTQSGYYNRLFLWVNGNSLIWSLTGGA